MASNFVYTHNDTACRFCGRPPSSCICGVEDTSSFDVCSCGCKCTTLVAEGGVCSDCLQGKCKGSK